MKSSSLRLAFVFSFVAAISLLAGCNYGYMMQAADWEPRIRDAIAKLEEVQSSASNYQVFLTNADAKKTALAKLDEVDALLSGIESEYPDSPPSYHDYLKEGIDEMQAAIVVGREAIEKKDVKKLQSFSEMAHAAGSKLGTWGQKVQGQ